MKRCFSILIWMFLLSACVLPGRDVAPTPNETEIAQTPDVETATPAPDTTAPPTIAAQPTRAPSTATLAPIQLPTAAPDVDFSTAQFRTMGYQMAGYMFVTLETAQTATREYPAEVNGTKFRCLPKEDFPGRLFCVGPVQTPGLATLTIFDDAGQVLYQTEFYIAPAPTNVP